MHGESRIDRNVIPRWRPLAGIRESDLESNIRFSSIQAISKEQFSDFIPIWRRSDPVIAVSELFDAFVVTSDRSLLTEAHSLVRQNRERIPQRLLDSINLALRGRADPLKLRQNTSSFEKNKLYVRRSIRVLKLHIRRYPRDGLAYLELARLYTILGQFDSAAFALSSARALAPDDRIVLRATLQFHDVVGALEDGWRIIRASDRLRFDPWVQSAEIAAATLLGKASKSASRHLINDKSELPLARDQTELAMAIATLERAHGVKERKVFQLVRRALPRSTENGFAQAVWLSDKSSRDFSARFPEAVPGADAFEASVDLALDRRDFVEAARYAELWVEDQPFSASAIIRLLNIRSILLTPTDTTIDWARRALEVHAEDWHVMNAAVLAFTRGGHFPEANVALEHLGKGAPSGAPRAYVHAAEGFLAFHMGNFILGRLNYESAAAIIRKERDYFLSVNASLFWVYCEAINGLMSEASKREMIELIDRAIKKIRFTESGFMSLVWEVTKQRISIGAVEESDRLDFVHTPVRQFLLEFDRS